MSLNILPVIMAGGAGTRLWPLSRALYPKQFLILDEKNESLFQQAHRRLQALACADIAVAAPCIVGNEEHRFLVLDQLREQGAVPSSLILEPCGKNTAPAVALAAHAAQIEGQDPILVITPADQTILNEESYIASLRLAIEAAANGDIIILGIEPDRPHTGYGYIHIDPAQKELVSSVQGFVEKPDAQTAQAYLANGGYFWNSGIFVMRASRWLNALAYFRSDIADAVAQAWAARQTDGVFMRPDKAQFMAVPAESVDYAVLEKCPLEPQASFPIKMVALNAGWSDLGAWDAVWQINDKDVHGNVAQGDILFENTRNSYAKSSSRLVSLVGVDDLVVIETADAVLVSHQNHCQEVKKIVSALDQQGRTEGILHRRVHRPWGWYDSIDAGPRFQVKRIMVKPKASLSLQMHHHRAEHWIVVSGTAEVTCGERTLLLGENQSTYIPLGEVHRLANPGTIPLEIIEVQSGSYLGEDDIVRFEDKYGR